MFEEMLNYGLVLSVDSCNLYLDRLSKECDKKTATAVVVFREFLRWVFVGMLLLIKHCDSLCLSTSEDTRSSSSTRSYGVERLYP